MDEQTEDTNHGYLGCGISQCTNQHNKQDMAEVKDIINLILLNNKFLMIIPL
jgi:hypothetical protein